MEREIFKDEQPNRIENRPLGQVSDFVVKLLPITLEEIRTFNSQGILEDLRDHTENLLTDFDYGIFIKDGKLDEQAIGLARLDLLMLEGGIVHSSNILYKQGHIQKHVLPGVRLNQILTRLSDINAMPLHLTYEDIVLNNPQNDKRVFTAGTIGASEADFYEGHRLIEEQMETGILLVKEALQAARDGDLGETVKSGLEGINKSLKFLVEYTGRIGRDMKISDFIYFREYLQSHPLNGLSGPSGQFTARVPLTEILLVGDRLGTGHDEYFGKYRKYFPKDGMKQIDAAFADVRENGSLLTVLEKQGAPRDQMDLIAQSLNLVLQFRNAHFRATKRQLLDTIEGPVVGTSGNTDSEKFLNGRIDDFSKIIKNSFQSSEN